MTKKNELQVVDAITGLTFVFKNHTDKDKFFDTWDETVIRVQKGKKKLGEVV